MRKNAFFAVLDSYGRGLHSGLTVGNAYNLGNFEACIHAPTFHAPDGTFFGPQYAVIVEIPQRCDELDLPTRLGGAQQSIFTILTTYRGTCIPSSCTYKQISEAWENTSAINSAIGGGICSVATDTMTSTKPKDYNGGEISFLVFFGAVTFFVFLGTALDVLFLYVKRERIPLPEILTKVLLAFSLYSNGKKLMSTKQRKGQGSIECLHGIRFFSMLWVFVGHMYAVSSVWLNHSSLSVIEIMQQKPFAFILEATVSTDTFFFLSGLLVGYLLLLELKKNGGTFNIPMYYIHRYIRLTAVYAVLMWFVATVYPRIGSGPLWGFVAQADAEGCQDRWWHHILYVQNFFPIPVDGSEGAECLGVTWYMAIDMQLYIIAPLFIVPLYYFPRAGVGLLIFLAPLNIASRLIAMYKNDWDSWDVNMDKMYFAPYQRFGVYALGILTAFCIIEARKRKFRFTDGQLFFGWVFSGGLMFFCILFPSHWYNFENGLTPQDTSRIFDSSFRVLWAVGLMWIVLVCDAGKGGPVNSLLSWKVFLPFSRLTYTAYLVHMRLQSLFYAYQSYTHETTHFDVWFGIFCVVPATFIVAAWTSLWFEAPIIGLEKIFLPQRKRANVQDSSFEKASVKS